jgi:hypothetical protein
MPQLPFQGRHSRSAIRWRAPRRPEIAQDAEIGPAGICGRFHPAGAEWARPRATHPGLSPGQSLVRRPLRFLKAGIPGTGTAQPDTGYMGSATDPSKLVQASARNGLPLPGDRRSGPVAASAARPSRLSYAYATLNQHQREDTSLCQLTGVQVA